MNALLADTGPLYALVVPSDQHHVQAQEGMRRLRREGRTVLVSYSTVCETQALLLRRVAPVEVHTWQERLRRQSGLIAPLRNDYQNALAKIVRFSDQKLSLFDGVVVVMSERLELPIWTFDSDFDIMKADVWR